MTMNVRFNPAQQNRQQVSFSGKFEIKIPPETKGEVIDYFKQQITSGTPNKTLKMLKKLKEDTINLLPENDLVNVLLEVKKSTEDAVVSTGRKILNKLTGKKPPQIEKEFLRSKLKYIPGEESASLGIKGFTSFPLSDSDVEMISHQIIGKRGVIEEVRGLIEELLG